VPSIRRSVLLAPLFAIAVVLGGSAPIAKAQYPDPDRLILQASARLVSGFGFARGIQHQGLMGEQAIRADFLFGKPGDWHVRFGPAVEARTACTLPILLACIHNTTLDGGLGGTLLLPFRNGYPIQITPIMGYAFRRDTFGGDGFYIANTLAWGYRPYNYFHRYAYAINAYATHRFHLDDPSQWEMTFGIEFDLELAIWVPILMLKTAFTHDRDPDAEEVNPNDPAERDVGGASTGAAPANRPASSTTTPSEPAETPTEPAETPTQPTETQAQPAP